MTGEIPAAFSQSPAEPGQWWRDAVVYQIYVRSFADSNADGIGDLPGITARLDAVADLGVDAIWLTPFYVSPQHDGGYDVADYRAVDPMFGTLADAEALIARAHELRLRVLVDIVPNHTSSMHRWFAEARAALPDSPPWDRYHCVQGKGEFGQDPPNDWVSVFGGEAWSPILDRLGEPTGYWYLHLFDSSQPDLNWNHPDVHVEMADTLRFWFDRGVDGFRIDVAHGLVKAPGYPALSAVGQHVDDSATDILGEAEVRPHWDQPGVHDIFREWRAIADSYSPPRTFCGEVWVDTPAAQAAYLRSDELHTVFNFDFLKAPWDARGIRQVVDESLHANSLVGAATTWVLSNHDVTRHASRYAEADDARGLLRARAMTTFMFALPGSAYVYQGEELGLPEVWDIAPDMRADPIFFRTGGEQLGRDGARVPLPWSGTEPSYGFGSGALSWLPQPESWAHYVRAGSGGDNHELAPQSTLGLYRRLLRIRRVESALGDGPLLWCTDVDADDFLVLERPGPAESAAVIAILNTGDTERTWPGNYELLASSGGSDRPIQMSPDGVRVPPDCAVWLQPVS